MNFRRYFIPFFFSEGKALVAVPVAVLVAVAVAVTVAVAVAVAVAFAADVTVATAVAVAVAVAIAVARGKSSTGNVRKRSTRSLSSHNLAFIPVIRSSPYIWRCKVCNGVGFFLLAASRFPLYLRD